MNSNTPTPTPAVRPSSGEPRLAAVASWAVLAASFGLSAATWIALAELAGFTDTITVLGVTVGLAWLMPIAVDGYVVVALVLWMSPVPQRVAQFAKVNTYAAAGIGVIAQSAYHAFTVWSTQPADHREIWRAILAAVVGALPPAVAGLAVHMRALIRRESQTATPTVPVDRAPAPVEQPARAHRPVVDKPSPTVQQRGPAVERPASVEQPTVPAMSGQVRPALLVPVAPSVFTRVNGSVGVDR